MELHVRVVEGAEVPKMDVAGKSDPYVVLTLNKSSQKWQTATKKNTTTPVWNQEFHLPITSQLDDILTVTLYDDDNVSKDDVISNLEIQVNKLKIGHVNDSWYTLHPLAKKVSTGGKVRLVLHLDKIGKPAFQ